MKMKLTRILSTVLTVTLLVGTIFAFSGCDPVVDDEPEYGIVYVLDGGINAEANPSTYKASDLPLTLVAPTKAGFKFTGWTAGEGTEKQMTVEIPAGTKVSLAYTANWEEEVYNISYTLNGGSNHESNPTTFSHSDLPLTISGQPTRTGYVFTGWTSEVNSGAQLTVEIPRATYKNLTFAAHWSEVEAGKCIVTYDLKGGTNHAENPADFMLDALPVTIKEPTRADYEFLGWTSEINTQMQKTVTIPAGTEKETLIFEAHWKANEHAISYVLGEGGVNHEDNPANVYTPDDLPLTVGQPTKAGFEFLGWTSVLTEDREVNLVIPAGETRDLVLTAVWAPAAPFGYGDDKRKAPDFAVTSTKGERVMLSDYYGDKPVFISFWAYWCGYCINEMNDVFKTVYKDMGDKVVFLVIHTDDRKQLTSYLAMNKYEFPIYDDESRVAVNSGYETGGRPCNYMVDKWGYLYSQRVSGIDAVKNYNVGTMTSVRTMKSIINAAITRGNEG